MYLYMLPLTRPSREDDPSDQEEAAAGGVKRETVIQAPTHDGGLEHTAATFDAVSAWLDRARDGSIILFPPQLYLLTLLSEFLTGDPAAPTSARLAAAADADKRARHYEAQRSAIAEFLARTPTGPGGGGGAAGAGTGRRQPAALVPWAEKTMSPAVLFALPGDGRLVLGLDKPGPELAGSGRAGDPDRVVLVDFKKEGPRRVEVRTREEALVLRREAEGREGKGKL